MPYAWICCRCEHPSTEHRLTGDALSVDGPYACTRDDCGCLMMQSTQQKGVSQEEYERRYRRQT